MTTDECGAVGAMRTGRRNWNTWETLCSAQIPHDLAWAWTQATTVGSRRLYPGFQATRHNIFTTAVYLQPDMINQVGYAPNSSRTLSLLRHHSLDRWGRGDIAPQILNLSIKLSQVVSFTLWLSPLLGMKPWFLSSSPQPSQHQSNMLVLGVP
jgi:hypothetical protein